MDVFLLILKIIGIVLLSLIALILLLLIIILVAPIRYKGHAEYKDAPVVHVKVSYLLFVRAFFDLEKKVSYSAKVFWITVFGSDKKADGEAGEESEETKVESSGKEAGAEKSEKGHKFGSKKSKGESSSEKTKNNKVADEKKSDDVKNESVAIDLFADDEDNNSEEKTALTTAEKRKAAEAKKTGFAGFFDPKEKKAEKEKKAAEKGENGDSSDNKEEPGLTDRISAIFEKVSKKAEDTVKVVDDEKNLVEKFINCETTKYTLPKLQKAVFKLLKHVLPRKLNGNLTFGMDDPATTGYILAAISAFYGLYCENLDITPDFEGKRLEGDVDFKGHIILGYVLGYAAILYFNKRVRKFLKNAGKVKDKSMDNVDKAKTALLG